MGESITPPPFMTTTVTTEKGRIVSGGMGGFLNPPGHPEHTFSVEIDLRRGKENRGTMSLSYAVDCECLDQETRRSARWLLNQWKKEQPAIQDPAIQDWICNVLGYFRGCYVAPFKSAAVSELIIDPKRNPLANCHAHAGVCYIRRFYPEFHPGAEHFAGACWGKRPDPVV